MSQDNEAKNSLGVADDPIPAQVRRTPIAKWIEVSQTYLSDDSPKWMNRYEATVILNRCEVRQTSRGKYLQRTLGVEAIEAKSKDELKRKVGEFILRDDVRVLNGQLEPNNLEELPRHTKRVPVEILNGTADIYISKDLIAHRRRRTGNEEVSDNALHHTRKRR